MIDNTKEIKVKALLFSFIFFLILLILNWLVAKQTHKNDFYSLQYQEVIGKKVDALNVIIGTSHTTHGVQPRFLKSKFYNFALNGANPKFYLNWYVNIFKPCYKKPKYMVIGLDWFWFDNNWLYRRYEQDAEYFPTKVFLANLFNLYNFDKLMLLENRYPVFKYRKNLLGEIFHHNTTMFPVAKFDNGFIPFEESPFMVEELKPENVYNNPSQIADFKTLINLLCKDSIKVIFVVLPTYKLNNKRFNNLPNYKYFKHFANQNGFKMLNYNFDKPTFININKHYYADGGHLNYEGSKKFSAILANDLAYIMR